MTTRICDKCGRKLERNEYLRHYLGKKFELNDGTKVDALYSFYNGDDQLELCDDCMGKIMKKVEMRAEYR